MLSSYLGLAVAFPAYFSKRLSHEVGETPAAEG